MTEKEIFDLQKKYIEQQKEDIFKFVSGGKMEKIRNEFERRNTLLDLKMDVAKRLQAYFTPEKVIKQMLEYSKKINSYDKLEILEPTAGIANIPVYILKNYTNNYHINMVEFDDKNREVIKELIKNAPDILNLYETKNFLRFINPIQYDLIIMNPPFHLRKSALSYLNRDYYDFDFVKRAFYMLKKGGELVALVSQVKKEEQLKWYKERDAEIINISVKNWTDTSKKTKEEKKATTINRIDLSIIILNKKDDIGLKEMNMEIDPDLTPKEEKKAVEYDEGIGGIKNDNYLNFDDWLKFVRERNYRELPVYKNALEFYPQLPPDPDYYNEVSNSNFDYVVNSDIRKSRRR